MVAPFEARPAQSDACIRAVAEIEGEDRKHGEEPLDERFPALPLRGGCRAVDTVQ